MGYMHIENLNKNDDILMFKQVWATEKVHGTSAHVSWDPVNGKIVYFSGGAKHDEFVACFAGDFEKRFMEAVDVNGKDVGFTVFGEAYGGKMQGMSQTYGKKLKFIVFEAKVGVTWAEFPTVRQIAEKLGLDIVPGKIVDTTEEALTEYRNAPSEVAVMNGCGDNTDRYGNKPPKREGIVLRPLKELRCNNGERIIAKYKNPEFSERLSKKDSQFILKHDKKAWEDAKLMCNEWLTSVRMDHVLDALGITDPKMQDLPKVIPAMIKDVMREGKEEVSENKEFKKIAGGAVVSLFKKRIGVM